MIKSKQLIIAKVVLGPCNRIVDSHVRARDLYDNNEQLCYYYCHEFVHLAD